jgi:hypothetical protein
MPKRAFAAVLLSPALAFGEPIEEPAGTSRGIDPVYHIERLSEADLKRFYLRCSRAALRGRMSTGEIALCSTGYERLLQVSFRGDFMALLEWRRNPDRDREWSGPSPF